MSDSIYYPHLSHRETGEATPAVISSPIHETTVFWHHGPQVRCCGINARVVEGYPGEGPRVRVKLPTGWSISGYFGYLHNRSGSGVSNFFAEHSDFPCVRVFGDYEEGGVMSVSREALERFVADHPPRQCDDEG